MMWIIYVCNKSLETFLVSEIAFSLISLSLNQMKYYQHIESKSLKAAVINLGGMSQTFGEGSVLFVSNSPRRPWR